MDPRPSCSLLLLAGILLHSRHCETAPSLLYTIDAVGLSILPAPTVVSGRAVTLRCSVSVSHDSSLSLMHVFTFTRYDATVYTVNTTDSEALYRLDPARAVDSGAYECRVQVKEKVKSSIGQTLTVTGLQTPDFQLSTTELYESEELVATCSAPQEKGALVFNFFQQSASGVVTLIKQVNSAGNWSRETKLLLRDTGDKVMFCNYSIPMLPQAQSSNSSNKLKVLVKGLFISPTMNVLPSTSVFEGDVVEVFCTVVNPPGAVDVYLTKDRKVLKQGQVGLSHRLTVQPADTGEYVCKAEYGAAQKETYRTITVKELFSRPKLMLEPIDVFEGEHLMITCSTHNLSERITYEDIQFSLYNNRHVVTRENTYSGVATASLNGNYTCKAQVLSQNTMFVKESATLVIKARVPVSQPVLSVVGGRLVVGKPFALRCHSDSGSLPITYTLHGPRRTPQFREVRGPGEQAVFNTSAIQKVSDIPEFFCQARNNEIQVAMKSVGQELLHSTEIIEPVSRPMLTLFPNEAYVSEGEDLTLLCSVQRGTPPVTFTWYHTERPSPLAFRTATGLQGSYIIPGVGGGHSGSYYCESSNLANDVKRSLPVVVGIKMAGWKKGLIAVICILLLMAIILVVVFKKGLLRRRKKELSVKSASTHPERLSLTKAEVNDAVNVTPGVMGRSVWSEHVSGSDTDEQNSVASPEETEPRYTEVQTRQPHPSRGPVTTKGTDVVYSEVRRSKQGVSEEPADGGSVEYAQLNNDSGRNSGHRNSGHHNSGGIQPDNVDDIDELNNTAAVHEECNQDPPTPDC